MQYNPQLDKRPEFVSHQGIFRRKLTMWEVVALIVSTAIGAGVLGIPYTISKVGVVVGMTYIFVIGFLMTLFNLLLADVATRTKTDLQLPGLAGKYLGRAGQAIMTAVMYISIFGVLVAYIIGVGESLVTLFGGNELLWSSIFFVLGILAIIKGVRTVKTIELILTIIILTVVFLLVSWSAPHLNSAHMNGFDLAYLFFPYGVILFAFHSSTAIPEAHTLIKNKEKLFKKAIIISGLIVALVYAAFAFVVVGVTGPETTEIATIGLGNVLGSSMFWFGNIFAILAMATSFLIIGLSLRDSLIWDYKVPRLFSSMIVGGIPFVIFLLGLRHFITVLDIVGGVFVSLEMLLVVLIYWQAKNRKDLPPSKFGLHHMTWLIILLLIALAIGTVYSVVKIF